MFTIEKNQFFTWFDAKDAFNSSVDKKNKSFCIQAYAYLNSWTMMSCFQGYFWKWPFLDFLYFLKVSKQSKIGLNFVKNILKMLKIDQNSKFPIVQKKDNIPKKTCQKPVNHFPILTNSFIDAKF